jgi:hypothetical protein
MNKLKLKIMATSLALSAASSGAWGAATNTRPELDPLGCFLYKAPKLVVSKEGLFAIPIPIITSPTYIYSAETMPLGVLRLQERPNMHHGLAAGWEQMQGDTSYDKQVNARTARGLFLGNRRDGLLNVTKNNQPLTTAIGQKPLHVSCVYQPFTPGTDLYLRPEFALNSDLNARTQIKIQWGSYATFVEGTEQKSLNKALTSEINCDFDNSIFTENASRSPLKVLDATATTGKRFISFWSVIVTPSDAYLTFHCLIKDDLAKKAREHLRLAALSIRYSGFTGDFGDIYRTDITLSANLAAEYQKLGLNQQQQQFTNLQKSPCVKAIIDRQDQGCNAITGYFYNMSDDFTSVQRATLAKHINTFPPIYYGLSK